MTAAQINIVLCSFALVVMVLTGEWLAALGFVAAVCGWASCYLVEPRKVTR